MWEWRAESDDDGGDRTCALAGVRLQADLLQQDVVFPLALHHAAGTLLTNWEKWNCGEEESQKKVTSTTVCVCVFG